MFNVQTTPSTPSAEVVDFMDGTTAWEESVLNVSDSTVYQGVMNNTNDNVFKRPVRVVSISWGVGLNFSYSFNPWLEFLRNPLVANRLAHYKMMRGTMRVRFLINGNPFYFGRAIASYLPLPSYDSTIDALGADQAFVTQASQRIHGYINPTTSQGCDLVLPFLFPKNFVDIVSEEFSQLGLITIMSINSLQHANNSTDSLNISVFVYMEEFTLSGVTTVVSNSLTPQGEVMKKGDEYGIVSGPAHTLANWSGKLSDAPYIGKYARATQMLASAAAGIASLFGYSKPPRLEMQRSVLCCGSSTAVTNVSEEVNLLSLDAKKEITVDPRVTGASGVDEMALIPLACRETYLTTFNWSPINNPGYHLFNMRVTPLQGVKNSTANPNWVTLTPSAWVSLPFQYWTGSMKVRLQIVCSAYHRGRLRIAWDPNYFATNAEPPFNQSYVQIVDITEVSDFSFKIGWGQPSNYLETLVSGSETDVFNSFSTSPYTSAYNRRCNGVIEITVLNELTTPQMSTAPVGINVFTSMCDDFEVAGPSTFFQTRVNDVIKGLTSPSFPVLPLSTTIPVQSPPGPQIVPPPAPAVIIPPVVLKTVPANGVIFGDFRTGNGDSPNFSNTIGVSNANKGTQLWNDATPYPYFIYTQAATDGNQVLSIRFSNPSANVRTITINKNGVDSVFTLPATIGATLWADLPAWPVKAGGNMVSFTATVTGAGGRIQVLEAKTWLSTNHDVTFVEATTTNSIVSLSVNPSAFTVSGSDYISTNGSLDHPADYVPGTFMQIISPNTLDVGTRSNQKLFRTQGSTNLTGQSMGAYYAWYPYKTWTTPLIAGTAINGTSIIISRIFYLRDTTKTFLNGNSGVDWQAYPNLLISPQGEVIIKPQGEIEENEPTMEENAPHQEMVEFYLGPSCVCGPANQVYFGEQASSWRQCLKRYTFLGNMNIPALRNGFTKTFPSIPFGPLTDTNVAGNFTSPPYTFFEYVSSAYLSMRGSGRIRLTSGPFTSGANVALFTSGVTWSRVPTGSALTNTAPVALGVANSTVGSNWGGATIDTIYVNRSVVHEIPYYSNLRFIPARTEVVSAPLIQRPAAQLTMCQNSGFVWDIHTSWAAGEDFSLTNFLNAPRILWT